MALVVLYFRHNRVFRLPNALPNREEGEPNSHFEPKKQNGELVLGQIGSAKARAKQDSIVADLARFFPEATPVRIPVELTRKGGTHDGQPQPGNLGSAENTVIEFGTPREVLFVCTTPLEFADVLRLRNSDGSLDTEASVVALQYRPDATVVAARFLTSVPNWIVKS